MDTMRQFVRDLVGSDSRIYNTLRWMRRKYNASGNRHCCYICAQPVRRFRPFRNGWNGVSPFIRELTLIGSDVENFSCPHCSCQDRERHLFMYFDQLGLWDKMTGGKILHFAPERHLMTRIAQQQPHTYIKADLYPSSPDIERVDVTKIPFDDDSFDVIICNHVLEHVPEDMRALDELFRILRPGGFAVLQTPYSDLLENSFCDPSINTDELRNRFFGQQDHVRVYGRDLFQRIRQAGFQLQVRTHGDILPNFDSSLYGVNQREDLILAAKGV